jgi:hypothetical protein
MMSNKEKEILPGANILKKKMKEWAQDNTWMMKELNGKWIFNSKKKVDSIKIKKGLIWRNLIWYGMNIWLLFLHYLIVLIEFSLFEAMNLNIYIYYLILFKKIGDGLHGLSYERFECAL